MTDEQKKEAYLELINWLEDEEHDIDYLPPRVELAIEKFMEAESLPAGAYAINSESVADLSRSFSVSQTAGLIPPAARSLLKIRIRAV